jgi:hypothetical protein
MSYLLPTESQTGFPATDWLTSYPALDYVDGDNALLGALGQAVLHDERVVASVLRVANHQARHHDGGSIATLGRAIALLGHTQVRGFCITARAMEACLRQCGHPQHTELLGHLAQAFHTAMQARQLLQDTDAEVRERLYLTAFVQLYSHGSVPLGVSAYEQEAITLADNVCQSLAEGWGGEQAVLAVQSIARFLGVSDAVAERRLRLCTHQSAEMACLYGVPALLEHLPPSYGPTQQQADLSPALKGAGVGSQPDAILQLKLLHELAELVVEKPDFDLVLHAALEGIQRGLGMDRCLACLLDSEGEQLRPRFALGRDNDMWSKHFTVSLGGNDSVFSDVVARGICRWVGSRQTPLTHPLCTERFMHITCGSECFVAPLQFGDRVIGILYADRYANRRPFSEQDFQTFRHFTLQVRMCLQLAMQIG